MYQEICQLDDIVPNSGVTALVGSQQVAIFRVEEKSEDRLFALSNFDPFSQANVLSRGIVGSLKDKIVVASPIYKQHFCLETGQCLEDEEVRLKSWEVKLEAGTVLLFDDKAVAA